MRGKIIAALCYLVLALIITVPMSCCLMPLFILHDLILKLIWILLAPAIYIFAYVLLAGSLSLPAQKAIISGTFPRDLCHPIYGLRRLYGTCWSAVYYFTPLYFICLYFFPLKFLLFRLFGYRGSLNFTIYADTWIRDLPLLNIEENAYISNKATLGTNICLSSGEILVKPIVIKEGALIGHLALIGAGSIINEKAEIGIGSTIGINTKIGKNAQIGPCTMINHYSAIGDHAKIGAGCTIGTKVGVSSGIMIPAGSIITEDSRIFKQEDFSKLMT